MAEAKAEVMEEIEDGREEGEEEDASDASSVRPGAGAGEGRDPRGPQLLWEGAREAQGAPPLWLPSLKVTGRDATSPVSWLGVRARQRGRRWDPVSHRERLGVLAVA